MTESSEKFRKFKWTKPKEQAAQLLAEDELTDTEIAEKVGITDRALYKWKLHPDFQVRIAEVVEKLATGSLRWAIAKRNRRVRTLDNHFRGMLRVIEERAADPTMADVPGGQTGLLVRTIKSIGSGEQAQVVQEYELDTGLLKELREHQKQAAQELDQWTERHDVTMDVLRAQIEGMSTEQIKAELANGQSSATPDAPGGIGKAGSSG